MKYRASAIALVAALALGGAAQAQDAGKPQYGAWGFDLAGADLSAKPGDDFNRYAAGKYQDALVIPADKVAYSPRAAAADALEKRVHEMMEAAAKAAGPNPATNEAKVGAYYASFMDEARIEAAGAKPIADELAAVKAATMREALAELAGQAPRGFYASPFSISVDPDLKRPERYVTYMGQAGLGLPDRDYYLDAKFAEQKGKYQAYVARLLSLAGWPEPERNAADIVAFETKIAEASWTKTQQRDLDKTYNLTSIADLKAQAPGFSWDGFLKGADLTAAKEAVVAENTAFPKIAAVWGQTPVATLQAWQAFRVADSAAPYLSKAFVDAHFDMRAKTLAGQAEIAPRWKRGVRLVSGDAAFASQTPAAMAWAVGEMYTDRYFPPESKAKVEALVKDVTAALRGRIQQIDWMSPATKVEALKKLDTYTVKIGYPDKPQRDYSSLVIKPDDLTGNIERAAALDWAFQSKRLNDPVDKTEWSMSPQTNNAYNGILRDIVFPAAILTPPIFDPNADPAVNYGAVGGVIGHELIHGFDDQGRKIDASGALRDWWTAQDAATFEKRAGMLGAQYDQFEPLPGAKVNGKLTMGENIADLAGLTAGLEAYRISLKGKPAPVIDGLTGDQRVFLGWAQAWRGKTRDDALRNQVVTDPHSPRQYRVIGPMRNMDAWYEAFGVKPGDKLFIAPDERVRLW
ncbi:MAG TPA: M13 family metallopeptidase [Phenylobacterium sp.]|nr:M13 family metallopeptidase [Phenylobacterium sp.]